MKFTVAETASILSSFEDQAGVWSSREPQRAEAAAEKMTKGIVGEESWRAYRSGMDRRLGHRKAEKRPEPSGERTLRRLDARVAELRRHEETCATCRSTENIHLSADWMLRNTAPCGMSFKRPQPTSR
jgi:hypothetical protein